MPCLFFRCFTSISSPSPSVLWIATSQEMEIKPLPSGPPTAPRTALGSSCTDTDVSTTSLPTARYQTRICCLRICFTHSVLAVQTVLPTPNLNHRTQSKTPLKMAFLESILNFLLLCISPDLKSEQLRRTHWLCAVYLFN